MKDIKSAEDIKHLVDNFYLQVRDHIILGYIFNDVASINWQKHLPVMYTFWESVLLGSHNYHGNPMLPHIALSKKTPLTHKEFDEWVRLFEQTVDRLFEGPTAQLAKQKGQQIASLMLHKITRDFKDLTTSNQLI